MKNKARHSAFQSQQENKIQPKSPVIYGFVENLLSALVLISMVFCFGFRLVNVDGVSMNTTLLNGDKLIVSGMYSAPKCGDIIVADCSENLGKAVVKRVIATEGQMLSINYESGDIAVDGVVLNEPYISTPTDEPTYPWNIPEIIPKGYVFVMGDNRSESLDSRDDRMQLIPVSNIVGKAEIIIFPFSRAEYLY